MIFILMQFSLMIINLLFGKCLKNRNLDYSFSYFVAGINFTFGLSMIIENYFIK